MATSSGPASAQDLLELPRSPAPSRDNKRAIALAALLIAVVLSVGIIFLELSVDSKKTELLHNTELRLKISASGRVNVLSEWLLGRIARAEPVVRNDLFSLFAAEVDLGGSEAVLEGVLAKQLPYMQAAIAEFARQNGLTGAYLLNREGRAYITSTDAPALSAEVREAARALFPVGEATVRPLEAGASGLRLDILVPLHPPQSENETAARRTVGVLLMSLPADERLSAALAPGPQIGGRSRARLVQIAGGKAVEVRPETGLLPLSDEWSMRQEDLAFAERPALGGDGSVYSSGVVVPGVPWIVVEEMDAASVLAPLDMHRLFGGLIVVLATIGFAAAALAFWWRQGSESNRMLAQQYHELAARLQTQRQLLDSINASIQEHISVKDREGSYIYVNPPFAKAVGLPARSIVGLKDAALYEPEVEKIVTALDQRVLEDHRQVERSLVFEVDGEARYFQVSKSPFLDDEGRGIGVVSVARDITDLMEAQQRRDQAVMNTIRALSNTVEAVDPYLSGHSRKLERIAGALARRLGCSDLEVQTLEIAANLSQIGKLSVPPEILTKAERLSPSEQEIMRQHIVHADTILRELDFGLPVREVLLQMHERLDGSGYPAGLSADDIGLAGRILAVADVFAARTAPRSYRKPIAPQTIVDLLRRNVTRYDAQVVEALAELIDSAEFDRLDLDEPAIASTG